MRLLFRSSSCLNLIASTDTQSQIPQEVTPQFNKIQL